MRATAMSMFLSIASLHRVLDRADRLAVQACVNGALVRGTDGLDCVAAAAVLRLRLCDQRADVLETRVLRGGGKRGTREQSRLLPACVRSYSRKPPEIVSAS